MVFGVIRGHDPKVVYSQAGRSKSRVQSYQISRSSKSRKWPTQLTVKYITINKMGVFITKEGWGGDSRIHLMLGRSLIRLCQILVWDCGMFSSSCALSSVFRVLPMGVKWVVGLVRSGSRLGFRGNTHLGMFRVCGC